MLSPTDALMIAAASNGNLPEVKRLIAEGADKNAQFEKDGRPCRNALMWAAQGEEKGHEEVVHYLLRRGVDVNLKDSYGYTALMLAAEGGRKTILDMLLGKDLIKLNLRNDKGETALFVAIYNKHCDVAIKLIDKKADVNIPNNGGVTPLKLAKEWGCSKVIRALEAAGAKEETKAPPGG